MNAAIQHQFRHGKTQAARNFSYSLIRQSLQRIAAGQPTLVTLPLANFKPGRAN